MWVMLKTKTGAIAPYFTDNDMACLRDKQLQEYV